MKNVLNTLYLHKVLTINPQVLNKNIFPENKFVKLNVTGFKGNAIPSQVILLNVKFKIKVSVLIFHVRPSGADWAVKFAPGNRKAASNYSFSRRFIYNACSRS